MIITFPNGKEKFFSFQAGCAGYVAKKIEIDENDVRVMRTIAERNPEQFKAMMLQLENRFESRRNKLAQQEPKKYPEIGRQP